MVTVHQARVTKGNNECQEWTAGIVIFIGR